MRVRNSREAWGAIAKLFHWVIALLVFVMIGLGLAAVNAPLGPNKLLLFAYHKETGLLVFALMVLRLLWRLVNPTPILPPGMAGWERWVAHATHWLIYAVVLIMPISGYVITSAANFPVSMFGLLQVPLLVPKDKELMELAESVHMTAFLVLSVLLVLHIAAALRHHFFLKDDILKRMLPGS